MVRSAAVWLASLVSCASLWLCAAVRAEPLAIEAPPSLLLGVDSGVRVRFRAPAEAHAGLFTNLGSFEPARQNSDGSWQTRYVPPATRYPQVAILALVSRDGSQLAWTRIALRGSATVELHSDPGVQVHVKVAGAEFGPVTTDATGRAALAVQVPPGVEHAFSSAINALGNERKESIPLNVPALEPLLSVCAADDARDFVVFAARPDGGPAAGLALEADASAVEVTGISAQEPGVYRVAFSIPAAARVGDVAALSVRVRGHKPAAAGCKLPLPLEAAERVEIHLSRQQHMASEREPIRVQVIPHYRGAREPAAVALTFKASMGQLSQSTLTTRAPAELTWALPQQHAGQTRATLHVHGDGPDSQLELQLSAAELKRLTLQLEQDRLRSDGSSTTELRVTARDAYGNAVHAQLHAQADGHAGEFRELAPGRFETTYRAPLGNVGSDRIVVRDELTGVSVERTLQLYNRGGHVALGVRAGYLTNFARVSAPLAVLQLGYRLPVLRERIRVSALAGYYQSETSVATDATSVNLAVGMWAVPIMLRAEYTFVFGSLELAPLIGAGVLGAHSRVQSAATGSWRDRHVTPLLAAGADAALPWGPGMVCLELAYWAASLSKAAIAGNAGGANVALGYELPL